jgi:hypothetical protein
MEKGGGEEKAKHLCTAREELRICSGRGICSEGPFAHPQPITFKHKLVNYCNVYLAKMPVNNLFSKRGGDAYGPKHVVFA